MRLHGITTTTLHHQILLFQVNVAVAGNMGSGKSTLIGVLSTGHYDNGKGSARTQVLIGYSDNNDDKGGDDNGLCYTFLMIFFHHQVLTHNHEIQSGRTSCISYHSLHFERNGKVF